MLFFCLVSVCIGLRNCSADPDAHVTGIETKTNYKIYYENRYNKYGCTKEIFTSQKDFIEVC